MLKSVYTLIVCVCSLVFLGAAFVDAKKPNDRLKDAFDRSHYVEQEPYSSNIEADDIFQESNSLSIGGGGVSLGLNDNVVVRFARFLMRMAVVLAVAMLIYGGIRIALALGDSGKLQAALKDIGIVLLGVFLALASVVIIFLITSLMRGSLDYEFFNS